MNFLTLSLSFCAPGGAADGLMPEGTHVRLICLQTKDALVRPFRLRTSIARTAMRPSIKEAA
jgi:hypothetical protein